MIGIVFEIRVDTEVGEKDSDFVFNGEELAYTYCASYMDMERGRAGKVLGHDAT